MKPPARCTVCRGAFNPPIWERFEPISRMYVGEVRCSQCGRAYLYQDTETHTVSVMPIDNNGNHHGPTSTGH